VIRNAPGNSVPWKQSTAMTRNVLPARRHGRKKPPVNPATTTIKLTIMKPPSLQQVSRALKVNLYPLQPIARLGNFQIVVYTTKSWRHRSPRRVSCLVMNPRRATPATLLEGVIAARKLAADLQFPVRVHFNRLTLEALPQGTLSRLRAGYPYLTRKLP